MPEIHAGDDLPAIVVATVGALEAGDVVVVSSKVVSKAEGRQVVAEDREQAITDETVRVVAVREQAGGGVTRIVENRLGIVGAAAGVDASNVEPGTVLLLPVDPDASAARLRTALIAATGVAVGVIVTDTLGRPWRHGQTDIAIGAAGIVLVDDLRGLPDASGRPMGVTVVAIADEIAALADLVKGKAENRPDRGRARPQPLRSRGGRPGRTIGRAHGRRGHVPARQRGGVRRRVQRGVRGGLEREPGHRGQRDRRRFVVIDWVVLVPIKRFSEGKRRLGDRPDRAALAEAFARDTLDAVAASQHVRMLLVVTDDPHLVDDLSLPVAVTVVTQGAPGLNNAIAAGLRVANDRWPDWGQTVLAGDLPALTAEDLERTLSIAEEIPLGVVADAHSTGTVMLTGQPGRAAAARVRRRLRVASPRPRAPADPGHRAAQARRRHHRGSGRGRAPRRRPAHGSGARGHPGRLTGIGASRGSAPAVEAVEDEDRQRQGGGEQQHAEAEEDREQHLVRRLQRERDGEAGDAREQQHDPEHGSGDVVHGGILSNPPGVR